MAGNLALGGTRNRGKMNSCIISRQPTWSLPENKGGMEDAGSRLGDKEYQELVPKLNQPGRIPDQVAFLVMSLKGLSGDVTSIDIVRHETLLQAGETLFKTHENLEHLAMMERILRSIPSHMLKRVGYGVFSDGLFVC
ncbi:hypothetical protein C5167_008877 [Papaver somniferum]|uniref:Uncharacterized protein n=1 Tax=Papaver somniferum TaxID=3469 RepID=A0A4Y7JWW5_PAPSO|nr:hypothetical protein C5167_008877 [Papaver somniferum]